MGGGESFFCKMKSVSLKAFPRSLVRRGGNKKLRAQERIPAVIYGRLNAPQNLEVLEKELDDLIHHSVSENLLVDLTVENDAKAKRLALVQDVQHHVLSGKVLHVDFHEVSENETVTITVPVEARGEALGVKSGGGVLEHSLFKLRVRALPKDLPTHIEVDVTNLAVGQSIHLGDIVPPAGVELLGDKGLSVFAVAEPLTEAAEAAATAAAGGPAEPEMIKEKKEDAPAAGDKKAAPGGDKKAAEKKK